MRSTRGSRTTGTWIKGAARLLPLAALACLAGVLPAQEASLFVTVTDEKTGESVEGLGPERFAIVDGTTPLRVVSAREPRGPVDIILLADTSMVGEAVRPLAEALIEELGDGEAMALVGYNESAELLQDFTSEKQFLRRALDRARYDALPRLHDAVFASMDGGFDGSANRKAIILVSNGAIAGSRVSEAETLELARAKRVSVFAVFDRNSARGPLRRMALRTGGASFAARRLKLAPAELAQRVFQAVRSPYELSVSGVYALGDRIEAAAKLPPGDKRKLSVSVLAID